ncbi:MAG: DUF2065 domain-containing protein [Cellvibrionaceae bacterium]|nr:DUF2065 domain-containing protein [Cellvibrionaceae bacterium]
MWEDWARALCLLLVLEGIIPFLNPGRWRSLVSQLAQVDDRHIRTTGLVCMLAGVGLLYLIN